MLKKALPIFLLTVFLFNLFGYFPLFRVAQRDIQNEMKGFLKRSIPDDQLYVITVPIEKVNNIDWKRQGKEFMYNGTMYDIVRYETEGDVICFHCVNDIQETQLFVHLEKLVNQQMNNDKSPVGKTAKDLLKMFGVFKYILSSNFVFGADYDKYSEFFTYSFFISPVFLEIPNPPPNPVV